MITSGRVKVNGKTVTELGTKVDPAEDKIVVDGMPVVTSIPPKLVYIALHKPVGVVSTAEDPNADTTVLDLVRQIDARVYPVGRLDADSSGLLLLTNDGDFANKMTHPRYHIPKTYRVRVRGFVDRAAAKKLSDGIELEDGLTLPADLQFVDYDAGTQCTIIDITLYEGRNRQVRRMLDAIEHPVRSLARISFGSIHLGDLNPGTWRKLRPAEVAALLEQAKPQPTPKKDARRKKVPWRPRNAPPRPEAVPPKEGEE